MSRRLTTIILVLIGLFGSISCFYGTNLLLSDFSNWAMGTAPRTNEFISSIPFFMIVLILIAAFIFVVRIHRHFDEKKSLVNLYTILFGVFSIIGIITSILSMTIVYHNVFSNHPFPLYCVICLIVHIIILLLSINYNILARVKFEEDKFVRKVKVKYVFYTIMFSFLTFYTFNRVGALLFAPIYVYLRNLPLTIPFYLSNLLPFVLLVYVVGNFYNWYEDDSVWRILIPVAILILTVIFGAYVISTGSNNPLFSASISPALGFERIATIPIETIFQYGFIFAIALYYLIFSISYNAKRKKQAEAKK